MTEKECKKVMTMVRTFYPTSKALQGENIDYAWSLVLQKYAFENVKAKILEYTESHEFPPVISQIVDGLEKEVYEPKKKQNHLWMKEYIDDNKELQEHSVSLYARTHGITWEEANEVLNG